MSTTCEVFERTAAAHAEAPAQRTLAGVEVTWGQLQGKVHRLAGGLLTLGVTRGEQVAMLLVNRPEFAVVDLATQLAGGTPMSIYATSPIPEIAYLLDDAAVRVVVTEEQFEAIIREAVAQAAVDPHVVVLGEEGEAALQPVADACPADFDAVSAAAEVRPEDVATLVYTSGTTGPPKGVQLTHRNLAAMWRAALSMDPRLHQMRRVLSYLPSAHIADRLWCLQGPVRTGACVTYVPDPSKLVAAMVEVRPTFFLGMPRMWEKLRVALLARVPAGGGPGDPEVGAALLASIGLDGDVVTLTGGAPLDVEILNFYEGIGLPLIEGYGMTEVSGVITSTRVGRGKVGSVGIPFDGIEIALADDGEILVRGEAVMLGYRNKPEATAEAIGADGWLRTGDVGVLDDGFLTIVGRKKELIITSGGKNVAPAHVENAIRAASPLAGPVVAIGDRRPYVTALISLDPVESQGRTEAAVAAAIGEAIEAANRNLAQAAQVKRFAIVADIWDAASGFVTPTLKVKRAAVCEHYAKAIDALYSA
ncbi:long-chain fatty acid--CoA ligase [Sporichthya sp.]|uniref:AMP-dependent synthetase/ligase n=1 Tax=Sporichthya sp. TaxID=65475 RepID=UPI001844D111|nr:AMP-dependent synthetase/ligase [Sporichthya sp.]MBA3741757.1 long-chain fatty acid--CoA ligase [Sporichthya sp.]